MSKEKARGKKRESGQQHNGSSVSDAETRAILVSQPNDEGKKTQAQ